MNIEDLVLYANPCDLLNYQSTLRCVCVQSVGFASKFHSISIPEDINTPSIIIDSNINNDLEQESQWVHEANIFFPSKFSDIETIKKSLAIIYEKILE